VAEAELALATAVSAASAVAFPAVAGSATVLLLVAVVAFPAAAAPDEVMKSVIPCILNGLIVTFAAFAAVATSNFWMLVILPGASTELTTMVLALAARTYMKSFAPILATSRSVVAVPLPCGVCERTLVLISLLTLTSVTSAVPISVANTLPVFGLNVAQQSATAPFKGVATPVVFASANTSNPVAASVPTMVVVPGIATIPKGRRAPLPGAVELKFWERDPSAATSNVARKPGVGGVPFTDAMRDLPSREKMACEAVPAGPAGGVVWLRGIGRTVLPTAVKPLVGSGLKHATPLLAPPFKAQTILAVEETAKDTGKSPPLATGFPTIVRMFWEFISILNALTEFDPALTANNMFPRTLTEP